MKKARTVKVDGETWKYFLDANSPGHDGVRYQKLILYPPKHGGHQTEIDATNVWFKFLREKFGTNKWGLNEVSTEDSKIYNSDVKKIIRTDFVQERYQMFKDSV